MRLRYAKKLSKEAGGAAMDAAAAAAFAKYDVDGSGSIDVTELRAGMHPLTLHRSSAFSLAYLMPPPLSCVCCVPCDST